MVALSEILSCNAQIRSSFPPGPVALFVGATSGIGAATLKAFAKYTVKPKAYFVGRSQEAADAIIAECQQLNPEGEYIFIAADVSLIKVVDDVCAQIQAREPYLNILFLSQGVARFDRPGNFPSSTPLHRIIITPTPSPSHPNTMTGADRHHQ
jgi:NAD(P)-dependent dehydrogenase (short-subunit alcohol dehydrogenase family)